MKNNKANTFLSAAAHICLGLFLMSIGVQSATAQDADSENVVLLKRSTRGNDKDKDLPTREVTGVITDNATGKPMDGVRVQAMGMEKFSTLTGEDGTYTLKVPTFVRNLYIYAPEYNPTQVVIVGGKANASLIGTAFRTYYSEGTEITARAGVTLSQTSTISIETDMARQLAGDINITEKNGLPGQGAYMTIRGINSINAGAQPLVVLDGNILDMQYDRTTLHEGFYNNVLSGLDPETVDNIQILKNGTALYGAKGANGVILINTKRGRSMATKINARIYGGIELIPTQLSMLNGPQYTQYLGDLASTVKGNNANQINSFVCLDQSSSNIYRDIFNNNTNWQQDMYRMANTQNYKISVEGGDNIGMYDLSLGYTTATSTLKGVDFNRLNLRFNTDIKISDRLSTALDIAYNQTEYGILDNGWSQSYDMQNISSTNVLGLIQAPFLSPYSYAMDQGSQTIYRTNVLAGLYASDDNTTWITNPFKFPHELGINEALRNPYWILENGQGVNKNNAQLTQIIINVAPKWQINKNLYIQDRFSYNLNRNNEKYFVPIAGATPYKLKDLGDITSILRNQFTKETSLTNDLRINWSNHYGAHNINALGGWRINNYDYSYSYMGGYNNGNDKLPNISKSMKYFNYGGDNDTWTDMTFYIQGTYNYANRYFAEFTTSMAGSSRFGKNTAGGIHMCGVSWGMFPSIQLGWVISNENWFKATQNGVNYLKMTFGWEKNGNDNLDCYAARTYWEAQRVSDNMTGLYLKNLENSSIQWETTQKINIGLEGAFLNNRLTAGFNLYWNRTDDLLTMRDISDKYYFSGITNYWTNEGSLTNRGFEGKVNAAIINNRDWKWELGVSVGHNKNEITGVPDSRDNRIEYFTRDASGNLSNTPYKVLHGYTSSIYGDKNILTAVGYSAGTFYGWQVDYSKAPTGVFSTDAQASEAGLYGKLRYYTGRGQYREFGAGDMAFVDQNGDGWIDESDKVAIGNSNPDMFGNIYTSLQWRYLRLDMNFKYSLGGDVYNYQRSILEAGNTIYNQTSAMARRWTYEGQVTDMPRACYTDNDSYVANERMSDRWIEDGSYLKLKNLRLTYTLPYHNNWLQGLKVWGEANNVFCLTKYLGTDPEFSTNNSVLYQGIDTGRLPQGRSFNFGISLNL